MIKDYLSNHTEKLTIVGPLYDGKKRFSDPVIFVDGGAKAMGSKGFSVGDNDSFDGTLNEILPTEKDYSDLAYVLQNIPPHYHEIQLLGFLGGRRDHELINIGEVHNFLSNRAKTKVTFDDEIIGLSWGNWEVNLKGLFSLFSFQDNQISLDGQCKYQLKNKTLLGASSHGLSNEGSGGVKITCERSLFILKTYN